MSAEERVAKNVYLRWMDSGDMARIAHLARTHAAAEVEHATRELRDKLERANTRAIFARWDAVFRSLAETDSHEQRENEWGRLLGEAKAEAQELREERDLERGFRKSNESARKHAEFGRFAAEQAQGHAEQKFEAAEAEVRRLRGVVAELHAVIRTVLDEDCNCPDCVQHRADQPHTED